MSADIWLEDESGDQIVIDDSIDAEFRAMYPLRKPGDSDNTHFNLTYNLTPMLREAKMLPWRDFIGMRASIAGPIWQRTANILRADRKRFEALNPSNGWGNYDDALEVIQGLADTCARFPDARIGGWL